MYKFVGSTVVQGVKPLSEVPASHLDVDLSPVCSASDPAPS